MKESLPKLGALTAVFVVVLLLGFFTPAPPHLSPLPQGVGVTQGEDVFPELSPLPTIFPDLLEPQAEPEPSEIPTGEVQPQEEVAPAPVVASERVAVAEVVTPPPAIPDPLPASGISALDEAAAVLRAALVNIVCYVPSGLRISSMSGSGVIIDPKGIILTNAHIAQYFLLSERGVSCSVRTGGPAVEKYKAAPIFISSEWIRENARLIVAPSPHGTGEHDFALLAITKSATKDPLPGSFPSITLGTSAPSSAVPLVIAGYGAQFLESMQIQSFLFPTVTFGSLKGIFTFGTNTVDVLELGGNAAAQKGSSGGGVADVSGTLVGTITTSTVEGATEDRSLDAITATYMRGAYASETGEALELLLSRQISESISKFEQKRQELATILVNAIQ